MSTKETKIEARQRRQKEQILKYLSETGNISLACGKVDIARDTYYRWDREDDEFHRRVEYSIELGKNSVNDLAHTALVNNLKNGDMGAVKFQLVSCHPDYMPKPKPIRPEEEFHQVDVIEVYDAPTREELERQRAEAGGLTGAIGPTGPASDTVLSHQV